MDDFRRIYRRHFENPRRERAFLHATGFTLGFLGCRVTTHAIRAQRGPFRNMSVGGRHLHHSTLGDHRPDHARLPLDLAGRARAWTPSTAPRLAPAALTAGLATALTLDEFALWFDLADDYWDSAGRKSIDAVVLFWGASAMLPRPAAGWSANVGVAVRDAVREARADLSSGTHPQRAIAGRSAAHGRAASICPASEYSVSSSPIRPASCTLSGSPSAPKPAGSEIAGWPVRLNTGYQGMKRPALSSATGADLP